jgi:DNA invertase Pin-like site-specific DNA recombinase
MVNEDVKLRAIVYSRVSTEKQDPKAQLQAILEYAKRKNYEIVKIFEESISGSVPPLERPVFKEALLFAKRNNINIVLLYDLTRFYRAESPSEAVQTLKNIMKEYGIVFDFVREPEIEDPHIRELFEFLKLWYASLERWNISLRTRYGLQKLKTQGKLYHRPGLPHYYGAWLFDKSPKELTREELEVAKKQLRAIILKYWNRPEIKRRRIGEILAKNELREMYIRFPDAPKSYWTYLRFLKETGGS